MLHWISTHYTWTVIKQCMQVYDSPYKTCHECTRDVYQKEGMHAFYQSFFTQLTMNIPFQSIHFMVYKAYQDFLNEEWEYHPLTHCTSGTIAGAVAAGVTTTLDICKTLLNIQERLQVLEVENRQIEGLVQAVHTIHSCCGPKGFFCGLSVHVMYQMPSTAISWSIYEFFKHYLYGRSKAESNSCLNIAQIEAQPALMSSSHDEIVSETSGEEETNLTTSTMTMSTLVMPSIVSVKNKSDRVPTTSVVS